MANETVEFFTSCLQIIENQGGVQSLGYVFGKINRVIENKFLRRRQFPLKKEDAANGGNHQGSDNAGKQKFSPERPCVTDYTHSRRRLGTKTVMGRKLFCSGIDIELLIPCLL